MIVGVDLDGTTVDFQYHWANLYIDYFDVDIPAPKLDEYDALLSYTHFKDAGHFFKWFARAGGWKNQPYILGARGGVDALLDAGHRVRFITDRPANAVNATWDWFNESPWALETELHIRPDKHMVPCDVYIDDTPRKIQELLDVGKRVIVFDQPWNQEVEDGKEYCWRAYDWKDVVSLVRGLEEFGRFPSEKGQRVAS